MKKGVANLYSFRGISQFARKSTAPKYRHGVNIAECKGLTLSGIRNRSSSQKRGLSVSWMPFFINEIND